jgi:hypothetical protein
MNLLRSICCLFGGRCAEEEPRPTTQTTRGEAPADLGQREAEREKATEDQLKQWTGVQRGHLGRVLTTHLLQRDQLVRLIVLLWFQPRHSAERVGECATSPARHGSELPPLACQQWPNVGAHSRELSRRRRLQSR